MRWERVEPFVFPVLSALAIVGLFLRFAPQRWFRATPCPGPGHCPDCDSCSTSI